MADIFNLQDTWDDAETVFNGIKLNVTDTASHADSKLLDLQVGGASKFSVASNGITDAVGYTTPNYFATALGSNLPTYMDRLAIRMAAGVELGWTAGTTAFTTRDLSLWRDAPNTLAQRNGVNAQTYNIYNAYTDATNYERAHIGWNDTADTFVIGTEAGGTGANRRTQLGSGVNGSILLYDYPDNTGMVFNQGGSEKFYMRPTGLASMTGVYYDLGGPTTERWGVAYTQALDVDQGTLTDDAQALNITSTWNDAADTFTLIKADVTDTASAAGSKLMDLQVGGTSKFNVDATGAASAKSIAIDSSSTTLMAGSGVGGWYGALAFFGSGSLIGTWSAGGLNLNSAAAFQIGGLAGLQLSKPTAATLQLGTDHTTTPTGQTIKAHDVVTGTGADLTLSGGLGSVANGDVLIDGGNVDITVGVSRLSIGSGATVSRNTIVPTLSNNINIGGPSQRWQGVYVGDTLDVAGSANITGTVKTTPTTVGALPAAATAGAGARTFVTDSANSLSSHHGQTVTGGGANFSPVYSDGTNWLAG